MEQVLDWAFNGFLVFVIIVSGFGMAGCFSENTAEAEPATLWRVTLYSGGVPVKSWDTTDRPWHHSESPHVSFDNRSVYGTIVVEKVE